MVTVSVAREPCASCPYRKDVPSGVWDRSEYEKLPSYDGGMVEQLMKGGEGLFMCHQRDGGLCAGWLGCHGSENLMAMRLATRLMGEQFDERVFGYECETPLWGSGEEAARHGMKDIDAPSEAAGVVMDKLVRKGKTG